MTKRLEQFDPRRMLIKLRECPVEQIRLVATGIEKTKIQVLKAIKKVNSKFNRIEELYEFEEHEFMTDDSLKELYDELHKITKITGDYRKVSEFYLENNYKAKTALLWFKKFPFMENPFDKQEQRRLAYEEMQNNLMLKASEGCIASAMLIGNGD